MTLYYSLVSLAPPRHLFLLPSPDNTPPCTQSIPSEGTSIHNEFDLRTGPHTACRLSLQVTMLTCNLLGVRTSRLRDAALPFPHRPHALQGEARSVRVHLPQPSGC